LSLPELYPQVNKAIGALSYRNFGLDIPRNSRYLTLEEFAEPTCFTTAAFAGSVRAMLK
jgi:hypothetical protein